MPLEDRIIEFQHINHGRVTRDDNSYRATHALANEELERLLGMYRLHAGNQQPRGGMQHRRLLRDNMDFWLRRYQGYVISGQIGAHYRQKNLNENEVGIFEHVIPLKVIRDMLIAGVLTVGEALNAPTCRISQLNDNLLRENGLVNFTPDPWLFFTRYDIMAPIVIETHDTEQIAHPTWTLENHYVRFGR
jgi:hypothetical protein